MTSFEAPTIRCILLLALAACTPSEPPTDTDADSDTDTDTDTELEWEDTGIVPTTLTHDDDIQPIWDRSCEPCHTEFSHGKLSLTAGYANIVLQPSDDVPSIMLVQPGVLKASYLWHKLQGTHLEVGGVGGIMPKEGVELPTDDLNAIEEWIAGGAPQ